MKATYEISIKSVQTMPRVGIVIGLRSLTSYKIHYFMLTFARTLKLLDVASGWE